MITFNKRFRAAIWDALWHWQGLVFVAFFSAGLSVKSPLGVFTFAAKDLISLVFPISGTIVALALPAAQLSMDLITQAEASSARILVDPSDQAIRTQYVEKMVVEYRENLNPAWRAVVYALVAFILSILGSLGFFYSTIGFELVASSSLGFLILSALWLYPTVRFAFKLEALDTMLEVARALNEPEKESSKESPS